MFNEKKDYFQNKLNECIGKPKELWKALGRFKDYYSNTAGNLSKKLPTPPNKFTLINTIFQHYKGIIYSDSFNLATVFKNTISIVF